MNPNSVPGSLLPGVVPSVGENRSSQTVNTFLAPGQRFTIEQAGTLFYLIVATQPIFIKPRNGSESKYSQGQGQVVGQTAGFPNLEVYNNTPYNVAISLFVGFGGFIDNTLIPVNQGIQYVTVPTHPVPNVSANLAILDKSGTTVVDLNGKSWLSINRISMTISNYDLASYYTLADLTGTKNIIGVPPRMDIIYESNGNFSIQAGGNINAIVSEVYSCIELNFLSV